MNCIPFIGIPVLNRGDLLLRCVESFDLPVGTLVIINNGRDHLVEAACRRIQREMPIGRNTIVVTPSYNLGVAASWNLMCSVYPELEYHMLVGSDMQFSPGALKSFHEFTLERLTTHAMIRCFQGYGVLALTQRGIENVGGFDESIYPAYFEDNDHHRRLRLLGELDTDISIPLIHGEHDHGSCTVKSDPVFASRCGACFGNNQSYYIRKWGGAPHQETFSTPFNNPELSCKGWKLDPGNWHGNWKIINEK